MIRVFSCVYRIQLPYLDVYSQFKTLVDCSRAFLWPTASTLFGVPCDSDTTVRYSSMSDDDNGPVGGMVQSSGLGSDRGRDGPSESDMQRQINALAPHKEDIDISKYIRKLEVDLINLGCPRARWKSILLQNLQSKSASAIVASLDRADTDHAQLKDILIEALSSSLTSLGVKVIQISLVRRDQCLPLRCISI